MTPDRLMYAIYNLDLELECVLDWIKGYTL